MRRRVLLVLLAVAFVLFVAVSAMTSSSEPTHTMPDGQTMDGSTMQSLP